MTEEPAPYTPEPYTPTILFPPGARDPLRDPQRRRRAGLFNGENLVRLRANIRYLIELNGLTATAAADLARYRDPRSFVAFIEGRGNHTPSPLHIETLMRRLRVTWHHSYMLPPERFAACYREPVDIRDPHTAGDLPLETPADPDLTPPPAAPLNPDELTGLLRDAMHSFLDLVNRVYLLVSHGRTSAHTEPPSCPDAPAKGSVR